MAKLPGPGLITGAQYNADGLPLAQTVVDGQLIPNQADIAGNLKTVSAGSVGPTGVTIPVEQTVTGSVTSATSVVSVDTTGYGSAGVQFTSIGSGNQATFEQSADNATWQTILAEVNGANTFQAGTIVALTLSSLYTVRLSMRYFRVRISTYSSGTVTCFVTLKAASPGPNHLTIALQGGVSTNAVGAAAVATGVNALSVEEGGRTFSNVKTATTTTSKSGAGHLHTVTCNTPIASASLTLFDNTVGSGTTIATITLPATLLQEGPYTAIYDAAFATGLTAVTVGTADWTWTYR